MNILYCQGNNNFNHLQVLMWRGGLTKMSQETTYYHFHFGVGNVGLLGLLYMLNLKASAHWERRLLSPTSTFPVLELRSSGFLALGYYLILTRITNRGGLTSVVSRYGTISSLSLCIKTWRFRFKLHQVKEFMTFHGFLCTSSLQPWFYTSGQEITIKLCFLSYWLDHQRCVPCLCSFAMIVL